MLNDLTSLDKTLSTLYASGFKICWEYDLLSLWLEQQKITREQLMQMVRGVMVEIFFDVTQAGQITFELKPDKTPSTNLVLIDADQMIVESWKDWQSWQSAKLADRSPNSAPIIRQKEQLESHTSPQTYQAMVKLFDGRYSLRDIAVQMQRDFIQVTRLTMPYVQWGFVELIDIPDLPTPLAALISQEPPKTQSLGLIACLDGSSATGESLQKIGREMGYDFLSINNPTDALSILVERKPCLVFLDINMPNTNCYELCAQLRKISLFSETPIIMLAENLGVLDRMKAKMVGCTDFLTKPIDKTATVTLIAKHLKQQSVN
jgi:chemotaxis family two-component system response regulator PixG